VLARVLAAWRVIDLPAVLHRDRCGEAGSSATAVRQTASRPGKGRVAYPT
jgi:hypothetical protein